MEIILGAVITIVLFSCLGIAFYQGYRVGRRSRTPTKELDEKEKDLIKARREGFQNIMNYNVDKAMERRLK